MNKNNIAANISPVKINHLRFPFSEVKFGTIIIAPTQPADKLTNKSPIIDLKTGLITSMFSEYNKTYNNMSRKIFFYVIFMIFYTTGYFKKSSKK